MIILTRPISAQYFNALYQVELISILYITHTNDSFVYSFVNELISMFYIKNPGGGVKLVVVDGIDDVVADVNDVGVAVVDVCNEAISYNTTTVFSVCLTCLYSSKLNN